MGQPVFCGLGLIDVAKAQHFVNLQPTCAKSWLSGLAQVQKPRNAKTPY
jgi:hypothetical protein